MNDYTLIPDASLAERTTFRVPARATLLAEARVAAALPELLARPEAAADSPLVLGGGSNILFTRDFDGLVVHLATRGIEILESDGDGALVRVAAGEDWDGFVRWSLAQGFAGLENLILIPGDVGAAPIQNIGAYGVEAGEFVETVEAWDRESRQIARFDNAACAFGYRDSLFKRAPRRYVVTTVDFRLPRRRAPSLDYSGVREELSSLGIATPTPPNVALAIEHLRRRKLPDPAEAGNAGSFFKNPIMPLEAAEALRREHPRLPVFGAAEATCKISAAWMIDQCGFKGFREGDAGVSEKHALVLVNYGSATGAQIWSLAQRIRDSVAERFGVMLEPEPLVL